nr:MAG TPA_asm: hypothetical protein [Caudoviricetes sp.]
MLLLVVQMAGMLNHKKLHHLMENTRIPLLQILQAEILRITICNPMKSSSVGSGRLRQFGASDTQRYRAASRYVINRRRMCRFR